MDHSVQEKIACIRNSLKMLRGSSKNSSEEYSGSWSEPEEFSPSRNPQVSDFLTSERITSRETQTVSPTILTEDSLSETLLKLASDPLYEDLSAKIKKFVEAKDREHDELQEKYAKLEKKYHKLKKKPLEPPQIKTPEAKSGNFKPKNKKLKTLSFKKIETLNTLPSPKHDNEPRKIIGSLMITLKTSNYDDIIPTVKGLLTQKKATSKPLEFVKKLNKLITKLVPGYEENSLPTLYKCLRRLIQEYIVLKKQFEHYQVITDQVMKKLKVNFIDDLPMKINKLTKRS